MTGKVYKDQAVRFPVKYSWGKSYVMLLYNYDSNDMLTQAMKNQTKESMTENIRNYI